MGMGGMGPGGMGPGGMGPGGIGAGGMGVGGMGASGLGMGGLGGVPGMPYGGGGAGATRLCARVVEPDSPCTATEEEDESAESGESGGSTSPCAGRSDMNSRTRSSAGVTSAAGSLCGAARGASLSNT